MKHVRYGYHQLGQLPFLLFIVLQYGCSTAEWPPNIDELRSNYFDNQELFFELADLLGQSDQGEIFVSKSSEGVRVSVQNGRGKSLQLWADPAAIRMNDMLKHLGLASARIVNGQLRYEVLQRGLVDGLNQVYYVAHSRTDIPIIDRCRALEKDPPIAGTCFVALDQSWRIEFNW